MVVTAIVTLLLVLVVWLIIGGLMLFGLGVGGVFGTIFMVLATGAIFRYLLQSQRAITVDVISTIGAAIRQKMPLPQALRHEAAYAAGRRSRYLTGIAQRLETGQSLSEAIRLGFPSCPGHALALIAAAERVHQVPAAVEAVQADLDRQRRERTRPRPVDPAYPVFLLIWIWLLVSSLTTFIIPKFKDIFAGMGTSLPAITEALFDVSAAVQPFAWGVGGPLLVFGLPLYVYTLFRPRRADRLGLLSRAGDSVKWRLPVYHWFERNHSLLRTVEALRLSLQAGATVDAAIAATIQLDVNQCFRRRLRRWLALVLRGQDVSAAARASRLGKGLVWAFDQKLNPSGALEVLVTLEGVYRSSYSYVANLLRAIFWPFVTLLMGLLVGFIGLALFAPMVAMVKACTMVVVP
ncbi:MAG TPA: type II secretion system F family protein [Phycisphaerae bacterium]|nr:type II secretion system F family protein [Phycisphaerae bacterium]